MPRKTTDGRWLVDIRPYGANGPRIRKKFRSKAEATRFEAFEINKAKDEPWNPVTKDTRFMPELIKIWYDHHGQHISSGHVRLSALKQFSEYVGNTQARLIRASHFTQYRATRVAQGTSHTTLNTHLIYIKAMFNRLIKLELINYQNPVKNVERIKTQEKERDFLSSSEIKQLLDHLKVYDTDTYMTALICLSTGARWSEAGNTTASDIRKGRIRYKETKSKRIREIPISEELYKKICIWPRSKGTDATEKRFDKALQATNLKKSWYQNTHLLRHTFAAHFMMNGGNLLTLQKILGHSDIKTTMIYAHLSPEHLADAEQLNPISVDKMWT